MPSKAASIEINPARISWDQHGFPYCDAYGDHYFSSNDGRAECRHVFINGNRLEQRMADGSNLTIAELGFGTGLNFLETWRLWQEIRQPGQHLNFISFELHPLDSETISQAISHWPELAKLCKLLLQSWPPATGNPTPLQLDNQTTLTVCCGDAAAMLANWKGKADAWYLDGFSPSKNLEMWSKELMQNVSDHTVSGGTFATYTAAGWVRRNLASAGFDVVRTKGHGNKRHMSSGVKTV